MTYTNTAFSKPISLRSLIKIMIMSVTLFTVFAQSAFAVVMVPDDAAMEKIEQTLLEHIDDTFVIDSAWISEGRQSFYQVIVLVGTQQVEKTVYINTETFELMDRTLIESMRQDEANEEDPIMTITTVDGNQEPSNNNFMVWGLSSSVLLAGYLVFKTKKAKKAHQS